MAPIAIAIGAQQIAMGHPLQNRNNQANLALN